MVPRCELTTVSCAPKKAAASGSPRRCRSGVPRWPAVRPDRCPRRSARAWSRMNVCPQAQARLVELLGARPVRSRGSGPPRRCRRRGRRRSARHRAAKKSSTGSPTRSARTRASAVRASDCSSSGGTRSGYDDVVEDPHDGGVVTGGLGDGDGLVGERLAAFERAAVGELRAQGGEHERPVGVVGRRAGRGPSPGSRPCRRR